jgi:hypothetical protein
VSLLYLSALSLSRLSVLFAWTLSVLSAAILTWVLLPAA